ncbi:hypothetical protein ACH42_11410 [Endozoicomonas sp. (ex Bugula neritina AB1)]|nr:hypothetical protein ACH42_11410 [Endozoicomonas sp. (ex Bugula neritina AB1)]
MKQVKVAVRKKGTTESKTLNDADIELKSILERLRKKGLNPMQMCQKLGEHQVSPPGGGDWSYDRVVAECEKFKIALH